MKLDHIEHADALTYLRSLPDESVNLIVSSPPYFGLRDYGTATWDGGDPACDHKIPASTLGGGTNKGHSGSFTANYRDTCGKCGAKRIDQQIGAEPTPAEFVAALVAVFAEAKRVLRKDGNCYVNLGDSYNGSGKGSVFSDASAKQATNHGANINKPLRLDELPPKSLIGVPWRFAFAMQDAGWILREDIIWQKPNPMPESVRDRCTRAHEYIFHFVQQPRYWYDQQAVMEEAVGGSGGDFIKAHETIQPEHGGISRTGKWARNGNGRAAAQTRNRRSVWVVNPAGFPGAHFATFPEKLIEPIILAACPEAGVVLDPFMGAGTTALVAKRLNRRYVGCDLNAEYVEMARRRMDSIPYSLFSLAAD